MDAGRTRQVGLETDVCIAGAGPAGLALAHALASAGVDVVLLESGEGSGTEPDPLDDGEVAGEGFDGLTASRRRGLGGTALSWNSWLNAQSAARYVPLDPIDFEPRPWVAHSGWPFRAADLAPYYRRAHDLAGLGPWEYAGGAGAVAGSPAIQPARYRVGLASVFTSSLPALLRAHPRVRVLSGATVTRLAFESGGTRVRSVEWSSREGNRGQVRAARCVLALGIIENARHLLLAGVEADWLGRGFMEHPRDWTLRLVQPTRQLARAEPFFEIEAEGPGFGGWGRLSLSGEVRRGEKLMGVSATLYALPGERIKMRGPLRRLLRRPRARAYGVTLNLEQAPDRENRVTLATRRDRFGLALPRLAWRWTSVDESSRVRVRALVREALEGARFGQVETLEQPSPDPNAHHHAGTTRMSSHPADGVVDANCRVHGTDNLFVAGASVFPTAGFANPTLTILALSLRLAERLAGTIDN